MKRRARPVRSGLIHSRTASEKTAVRMPPTEFDEAGADEIAHAFDVVHDARDQQAGFIGIVIGDRQAADVLLHFAAQFGDEALGLFREHLGERERRDALDDGGAEHGKNQGFEQAGLVFDDDVIHQELGGGGQNHAADAVDDHQARSRAPTACGADGRVP